MSSGAVVDREAVTAAFDALDAALDGVAALTCERRTTPRRFGLLGGCEGGARVGWRAAAHPRAVWLVGALRAGAPAVTCRGVSADQSACPPGHPGGAGRQTLACGGRVDADQPRRGLPAHP